MDLHQLYIYKLVFLVKIVFTGCASGAKNKGEFIIFLKACSKLWNHMVYIAKLYFFNFSLGYSYIVPI